MVRHLRRLAERDDARQAAVDVEIAASRRQRPVDDRQVYLTPWHTTCPGVIMHESAFAERPSGADEQLARCEERIGYFFNNRDLLRSALTHASGADNRLASNERLEFLGDAILGYVVCELLYEQFPLLLEGDLTKIKSVVVSRKTCAKISRMPTK